MRSQDTSTGPGYQGQLEAEIEAILRDDCSVERRRQAAALFSVPVVGPRAEHEPDNHWTGSAECFETFGGLGEMNGEGFAPEDVEEPGAGITSRAPSKLQSLKLQAEGRATIGGLDWSEGGIYGDVHRSERDSLRSVLRAGQLDSRAGGLGLVDYKGFRLKVGPSGGNDGVYYAYRFECDGTLYLMQEAMDYNEHRATVRVQAGSETLMRLGHWKWLAGVKAFLRRIGFRWNYSVVSRVDPCLDIVGVTPVEFERLVEDHCIRRCRHYTPHHFGKRVTNVEFGTRRHLMLRMYDKKREVIQDRPDELKLEVMKEVRWGGKIPDKATRVEWQVMREVLRNVGLTSFEEVFNGLDKILDFVTSEWLRFTAEPVDRRHTDRAVEVHPLWKLVIEMASSVYGPVAGKFDGWRKPRQAEAEPLKKQAVGCLSSYWAMKGFLPRDKRELMQALSELVDGIGAERVIDDVWSKRATLESSSCAERLISHIPRIGGLPEPMFDEFGGAGGDGEIVPIENVAGTEGSRSVEPYPWDDVMAWEDAIDPEGF